MNKIKQIGLFLTLCFLISGCEENIPIEVLDLPDADYYLGKSVEYSRASNHNKAIAHFNTFLRFHKFKDADIYDPDSVKLKSYENLLSKIPKNLANKHSITSITLKNIHLGESIDSPVVVATKLDNIETTPEPQASPVTPKKESVKTTPTPPEMVQEKVKSPPIKPSRVAEKVAVAESIRQSPKLRRLIKKYTKDKKFVLKPGDGLTIDEVIESFGLQARKENIKKGSEGFEVSLPYSAQHLGGLVGKKKQSKYIISPSGETIEEIINNVGQIIPAYCAKRKYRCSSFSKKVVSGRIAETLPKAAKSIYLWNRGVLQKYSYEELLAGNVRIQGGTQLDIFTDFQY
jgi:hypothetical protein